MSRPVPSPESNARREVTNAGDINVEPLKHVHDSNGTGVEPSALPDERERL